MAERIPILNIEIDNFSLDELLSELKEGIIVTPNVDHLVMLQHDKEFYDIYQKAEYVILDSQVVKIILRLLGTPAKAVISGSDFFPAFYKYHKDNPDIQIFLLGAMPGVAANAKEIINNKVEREIITGYYSPEFGFEKDENYCQKIIDMINESKANVLAVGLGAPKQEKWISKYRARLKHVKILMGIGATIDFEAGSLQRAPKYMRILALEWLYRLYKEPKRLWKRYIVNDLPFFWLVFKYKIGRYKNPFG